MKLVLFDIDGTLLSCGPQVRPIFAVALVEVFGTAGDVDAYDFTGRTDPGIVLDLVTGAGVPEARRAGAAAADAGALHRAAGAALERDGMRLLPGVVEILERLADAARTSCSPC